MKIYQVDAFTRRRFHGNPAAVIPVETFPEDGTLLAIAGENNLSETAFFTRRTSGEADFHLRWFTPAAEVDLCGHATLAASHVLWTELGFERDRIVFDTRSGHLTVTRDGGRYSMDFPAAGGEPEEASTTVIRALGRQPAEVIRGMDLLCVFENKRDVHEIEPDLALLSAIETRGVIVTAPGAKHDFVSRFFAPSLGVAEDSVTGSAHCMLVPYWAKRIGRAELTAHQVSKRGGELWCKDIPGAGRVEIAGHAVTYLRGDIQIG